MEPNPPARMSLNEQCSMVQAKIMATRERLRLARLEHHPEERDAVGGAPEQQLEDVAQLSSNPASRPMTAELKSSCGVDDEAPEEGDGAAELLQSGSSSSDDGRDSDSEDDGALARAEESVAAAPAAAKLPPPRELFEFNTEEADARLAPPKLGKEHAILYPPPRHIDVEPAEPEPLRVNADIHALVAQCMAADAERLQNPALSQNRVVYDCHEPLDVATNPFVQADCLYLRHPPTAASTAFANERQRRENAVKIAAAGGAPPDGSASDGQRAPPPRGAPPPMELTSPSPSTLPFRVSGLGPAELGANSVRGSPLKTRGPPAIDAIAAEPAKSGGSKAEAAVIAAAGGARTEASSSQEGEVQGQVLSGPSPHLGDDRARHASQAPGCVAAPVEAQAAPEARPPPHQASAAYAAQQRQRAPCSAAQSTTDPCPACRQQDGGLLFESRFESGNLRRAVQVSRPPPLPLTPYPYP